MNFDLLSNRQKLALICYYAIKYGRFNDKGVLIPPPEFGDEWGDFDAAVGAHYGQTAPTVKMLRDLMIARFPATGQNGWRNENDPDDARGPEPMGGPVAAVYIAAKLMSRLPLWNVIVAFLPRPYSRRKPRTEVGFVADDTNTRPREQAKKVKRLKKFDHKSRVVPCGRGRVVQLELILDGAHEDTPPIRVTMGPNSRITRTGDEIIVEAL